MVETKKNSDYKEFKMENKWRFPNNNYGPENGLDTGDVETFKKDPDAALAREICQNTIDAQLDERPIRVEFQLFEIDRLKIPGINDLTNQINKCYEYKKGSEKEEKSLKLMNEWINKEQIKCLRISDFNTTGLLGVAKNEKGKPFYNLTKGAGVSDKLGTSGGSKGIGKFASFVASTTNTVFYSTFTKDFEEGYIGISKLRSVPVNEEDNDLLTMGIGYFGASCKNEPILEQLVLDPSFKREEYDFGTDVYLVGFNISHGWQNDIVSKVLDSFMVAIVQGKLEVKVDNIEINKNTLSDILNEEMYFANRNQREVKDIKAQYELLSEEHDVFSQDLEVGDGNIITVYVKRYSSENENKANKRCIMVRYPYIKIKHMTGYSYLPYSALCIIHDNALNHLLRSIENPQHTDWELKRLDDYPEEKRKIRKLKKEMEEKINNFIKEVLKQSDSDSTDVEGAGEFLPSQESGVNKSQKTENDIISTASLKRNKPTSPRTEKSRESEFGYDFESESDSDSGSGYGSFGELEGANFGNSHNTNGSDNKHEGSGNDSENEKGTNSLKKVSLGGMKFKNIVVDKKEGRFDIVFNSLYDEKNCELELKMFGEGADKYPVKIIRSIINGQEYAVSDGKIINISLKKGIKYTIECTLDAKILFASEVILNAYR